MTRRVPLTPQGADDVLEAHGWTIIDLYELVHAFARKLHPKSTMKVSGGRVMLWIKQERR